MLTIYVSPHEQTLITVDGCRTTVKVMFVRVADGFISLQDWEPSSKLEDVEIVLVRRFFRWKFRLPSDLREAMLYFLSRFHAKQDIEFDCYAFANLVKKVEVHKVPYMPQYWTTKPLPWKLPIGSVVFFRSGKKRFHHASIYIGLGLYISIWGAGGDLEIASLKSMKRDYGADEVVLAQPRKA